MHQKIRKLTYTGLLLALLICLQWAGSQIPSPLIKQLITGTMVNCILAVTVLLVGRSSALAIALLSPVFAFLLGIAPQIITVLPIMAGNALYILILGFLLGTNPQPLWRSFLALGLAALAKFIVLYLLVVVLICDLAAPSLLGQKVGDYVLLGPKMLLANALPLMFSWPQLVTALSGGSLAILIAPTMRKIP